jgi:hypothetical protein
MSEPTHTCAQCGGVFTSERSDEEAHAEAMRDFGKDGRQPGMVVVCDDCYREIVAMPGDESIAASVQVPSDIATEDFAELVRREMAVRLDAWCRAEADRMQEEWLHGT